MVQVRKLQDFSFRLLLLSVIEDDELGRRDQYLLCAIQVFVFGHLRIFAGNVQKEPQGKIRVIGGLVLIQRQACLEKAEDRKTHSCWSRNLIIFSLPEAYR